MNTINNILHYESNKELTWKSPDVITKNETDYVRNCQLETAIIRATPISKNCKVVNLLLALVLALAEAR